MIETCFWDLPLKGDKPKNELNRISIMGTKSAWTPERRARQAEIIRKTKPWEKSTGPKTEAGKAVSSRNAMLPPGIKRLRDMQAEAEEMWKVFLPMVGRKRKPRMPRWPKW